MTVRVCNYILEELCCTISKTFAQNPYFLCRQSGHIVIWYATSQNYLQKTTITSELNNSMKVLYYRGDLLEVVDSSTTHDIKKLPLIS